MGTLASASLYTALDFSTLWLLRDVHWKIIAKKCKGWQEQFRDRAEDRDPGLDSPLAMNLAAGFLYASSCNSDLTGQLKQYQAELEAVYCARWKTAADAAERACRPPLRGEGAIPLWGDALVRLLSSHSHVLFNTYYYVLTDAFGERALVPVIPGCVRSHDEIAQEIVREVISGEKLPFHLNKDYAAAYETQVLPLRGGLTPYICWLFEHIATPQRVWRVPYFLGDFSILLKHADVVQRHLSALVGVIAVEAEKSGRPECRGAYVLTSAIPNVFREETRGNCRNHQNDVGELAELLQGQRKYRLFAEVHRDLRRYERGVHTHVQFDWEIQKEVAGDDSVINTALEHLLGSMVPDGTIALRATFGEGRNTLARLTAINMEGVVRAIRASFPTGPWLSPQLASPHENQSMTNGHEPVIDVDEVRRLCRAFSCLARNGQEHQTGAKKEEAFGHLLRSPLLRDGPLEVLLPGAARCREKDEVADLAAGLAERTECFRVDRYGALLVLNRPDYQPSADQRAREVKEFLHQVLGRVYLFPSAFGAGATRVLTHLQREWDRAYTFGRAVALSQPEPARALNTLKERLAPANSMADLARLFCEGIELLQQVQPEVRAVLVLTDHRTSLPQKPISLSPHDQTASDRFWQAYRTFASFWLFEALNHGFGAERTPAESLITTTGNRIRQQLMDEGVPLPHRFWYPEIESRRSSDSANIHDIPAIPAIRVELSDDEDLNERWVTALTYLGIPVYDWQSKDVSYTDRHNEDDRLRVEIKKDLTGNVDQLRTIYRQYTSALLHNAAQVHSIRRAFQGADGNLVVNEICVHEVQGGSLRHDIKFSFGEQQYECSIPWTWEEAADLEFCGLNTRSILQDSLPERAVVQLYSSNDVTEETRSENVDLRALRLDCISTMKPVTTLTAVNNNDHQLPGLGELLGQLRQRHDKQLAEYGTLSQRIFQQVAHEICTALPDLDGLIASVEEYLGLATDSVGQSGGKSASGAIIWLKRVMRFLSDQFRLGLRRNMDYPPQIAAPRARRIMRFVRHNIALYGGNSDQADLFGRIDSRTSARAGIEKLLVIGAEIGAGLAIPRCKFKFGENLAEEYRGEESWFALIQRYVRASYRTNGSPQTELTDLWFPTATSRYDPELRRRLAAQSIIVTTVGNAVQHLLAYIAMKIDPNRNATREAPSPFASSTKRLFENGLKIVVSEDQLIVQNKALSTSPNNLVAWNSKRPDEVGTLEVIQYCLKKERFGWDKDGQIPVGYPRITALECESGTSTYELLIDLPQPFWRRGT